MSEGFRHLCWGDLDRLTRAELQERVTAELAYWEEIPAEEMGQEQTLGYLNFVRITARAIDPAGVLDHASSVLHGEPNGFWEEIPGR
ncbi:hypothetical protein IHE61_31065 [Streptomyces sp. GKU 257-1]|nr:hypothetical protein [Streptomyces sp. GKU 257-1]